jgi:acyl-coenzyme A thioesterase PaaI-like protein
VLKSGDVMNISKKQIRQQRLLKELEKNPFLTDEQLAQTLKVSIQTIRLDRLGKGIPELRERTRQMAENAQNKLQAISSKDIVGELLDLELGKSGISMMNVTPDMVMAKTGIARGHFMFAQANTLALAVVDAPGALTGVGNVKYKVPIYAGANLIAKAEVIRKEDKKYFIWVKIRNNSQEVFRAKFIVVSLPNERIV